MISCHLLHGAGVLCATRFTATFQYIVFLAVNELDFVTHFGLNK